MIRIAIVLATLLAILVGSPARAAVVGNSPSVNRAAVSGLTDAQIESDIKARLARSAKLSLDKFSVKVQGGIATFEGKTNVVQHKGTATRMAKSAGAKAVVNHIQISDEARKRAAQRLSEVRQRAGAVNPSAGAPAPPKTAAVVH